MDQQTESGGEKGLVDFEPAQRNLFEAVGLELRSRFETVETGHMPFLAHPERCARLLTE